MKTIIIILTFCSLLFSVSCTKKDAGKTAAHYKDKSYRGVAAEDVLRDINDVIFKVKDPKEVEGAIDTVTRIAQTSGSVPARIYAMILKPVRKMRSVAWRITPWLGRNDGANFKLRTYIHTAKYSSFLVGTHPRAFVDYLIMPDKKLGRLETSKQVQAFLQNEIKPALMEFISEANQLLDDEGVSDRDFEFMVDQRIATGDGPFFSKEDLKAQSVKGYIHYLVAYASYAVGSIDMICAYNLDDVWDFANVLALKSAIHANAYVQKVGLKIKKDLQKLKIFSDKMLTSVQDKFLETFPGVKTTSPLLVYGVLNDNKFEKLLTFISGSEGLLKEAELNFKNGIAHEEKGFLNLYDYEKKSSMDAKKKFLVPLFYAISENPKKRLRAIRETKALFGDQKHVIVFSEVTGSNVQVDIKALFKPHKDLKHFYPVDFVVDKKSWDHGKPVKWNDYTLGGLIPGTTKGNFHERLRDLWLTPSTNRIFNMIIKAVAL
ncbi:MAG: hypothetical protein KAQ98_05810 [Bacteriovoracaceae bacterium]|nr:hypothetical protein [Bacteriovoracaceae bacterium]